MYVHIEELRQQPGVQGLVKLSHNAIDRIRVLECLLAEAREWVTDKPWDDTTHLHKRISQSLGLPVSYPDWDYDEGETAK